MGIKGLTKLLAEHAPKSAVQRRVEDYRGRIIAVDASLSIYQFLGMLNRTIRMLEAGIKPVFVFDGEPPELKRKELAKRSLTRDVAAKDLDRALENGDEDSIEKFSKRTVKVTKKHNDDCKRLLRLMGVPVVEAPGEAEAQCAALCENHMAYAVASEDMDSLTFGARRFLHHLTDLGFKKSPVTEFEVSKVLEELGLTMDQFIDLCMGGQRALKLIRQHGCIEEVLQNLKQTRYSVPEDWPYQEVRTLFKEPNAVDKIKAARDRFSPGRFPRTKFEDEVCSTSMQELKLCYKAVTVAT
ncbi:hypothetical protein PR202_gb10387 [Eleusine coracana subsp. coracana]|uniref:Flap endonuclease 1 n=1 Tax=Eleusine coracana subsp. coracana TaxID=191504 RepID=A0AAV5EJR7_ELECO|nr:hypothetical protein PR202_gb10387 [Eleusine coracana subsp. coracana]